MRKGGPLTHTAHAHTHTHAHTRKPHVAPLTLSPHFSFYFPPASAAAVCRSVLCLSIFLWPDVSCGTFTQSRSFPPSPPPPPHHTTPPHPQYNHSHSLRGVVNYSHPKCFTLLKSLSHFFPRPSRKAAPPHTPCPPTKMPHTHTHTHTSRTTTCSATSPKLPIFRLIILLASLSPFPPFPFPLLTQVVEGGRGGKRLCEQKMCAKKNMKKRWRQQKQQKQ